MRGRIYVIEITLPGGRPPWRLTSGPCCPSAATAHLPHFCLRPNSRRTRGAPVAGYPLAVEAKVPFGPNFNRAWLAKTFLGPIFVEELGW